MEVLTNLTINATVARLIVAIADDADEATLKKALEEFPGIVEEMMRLLLQLNRA